MMRHKYRREASTHSSSPSSCPFPESGLIFSKTTIHPTHPMISAKTLDFSMLRSLKIQLFKAYFIQLSDFSLDFFFKQYFLEYFNSDTSLWRGGEVRKPSREHQTFKMSRYRSLFSISH